MGYFVVGILYAVTVAFWMFVHYGLKYGFEPTTKAFEAVHNDYDTDGDLSWTNAPMNLILWPVLVTANMLDYYRNVEEYLIGNGYRPLN